jgi:hypothetical protein
VAVLVMDSEGKIILRNRQQHRNQALLHPDPGWGTAADEPRLYEGSGKELLAPEMFPERRAARGEDFSDYVVRTGEDGKQRAFSTSGRALRTNGRFEGAVVTFSDVPPWSMPWPRRTRSCPMSPMNCAPRSPRSWDTQRYWPAKRICPRTPGRCSESSSATVNNCRGWLPIC